MKGFIKLTTVAGNEIRMNINQIGHYYNSSDKSTIVGITTHNNGGFKVTQTAQEIDELIINNSK
jgi:hypothetical protein